MLASRTHIEQLKTSRRNECTDDKNKLKKLKTVKYEGEMLQHKLMCQNITSSDKPKFHIYD